MFKLYHEEIKVSDPLRELTEAGYYKKTSLSACDFVLFPRVIFSDNENNFSGLLAEISEKYLVSTKWVLLFVIADYEKKYPFYPNLILFRTSLRSSLRRANEHPLPYVWENYNTPFDPIETVKPKVGFCGLASKSRRKLLRVFEKENRIETNFIIRDKFWGGKAHDASLKKDFDEIMQFNPFILCQRGKGNFSMRFYQTLSAGRIPVLINTDMILPFENEIDWENLIVLGKNKTDCLQQVVVAFETGRYKQMQQDCRRIFEAYFSRALYLQKALKSLI